MGLTIVNGIEKYKAACESALKKLNDLYYKVYRKNPECHARYSEEWKIFWVQRSNQLKEQGKDYKNYEFKTDWISYWLRQMELLHKEDLLRKQEEIRKQFGLSEEAVKDISFDSLLEDDDNETTIERSNNEFNIENLSSRGVMMTTITISQIVSRLLAQRRNLSDN